MIIIETADPDIFNISDATIRGCDWTLIRKTGQGTYAWIAGPKPDSNDEEIVIEEYSDPEERALWDNADTRTVATWVFEEIKNFDE